MEISHTSVSTMKADSREFLAPPVRPCRHLSPFVSRTRNPSGEPGRTTISAIEGSLPIAPEGRQPDVLAGLVVELLPVVAAPALGSSYTDPARRPVHGAGGVRGLDEVSMSTGVVLYRSVQSTGRRRRTMASMCEPRFGISIQGRG